ncbi:MAG: hypothetical protein P1Q69_12230 [Candidatus Thorarchaeota archaeon]|nr:hypothetical protein [Candidatus Thorarchaeota archaeon]
MSESKQENTKEFWLFHDEEISEILELREFIDPELDLSPLEGIMDLFDKLNHLLE